MKSLAEVTNDALNLPLDQRFDLIRTILDTTDTEGEFREEVHLAWEEEIGSRIRAVQSGKAQGRQWEAILQDIDAKLAR